MEETDPQLPLVRPLSVISLVESESVFFVWSWRMVSQIIAVHRTLHLLEPFGVPKSWFETG